MVLKFTIEYDGTDFSGWQIQKDRRTVQGTIVETLSHFFKDKHFKFVGAGRTDAGVHALGQVASLHFQDPIAYTPERFRMALNANLPNDIYIRDIKEADENFHAMLAAKGKVYRYSILKGRRAPLHSRYVWEINFPVSMDVFENTAMLLKGKHDFTHLRIKDNKRSPFVEIKDVWVEKNGDFYELYINGDRFLYKLIRLLVGEMVKTARGKKSIEDFKNFIKGERGRSFSIAPPRGLCLIRVYY